MPDFVLVFAVQFAYVFLLGFQSRNVRDGQFAAAALTSLSLGVCGLFLAGEIAKAAIVGGRADVRVAYVIAGPIAICCAMWFHDRLSGGAGS